MGTGRGTGRSYNIQQYRWTLPLIVLVAVILFLKYRPNNMQLVDTEALSETIKSEVISQMSNVMSFVHEKRTYPPVKQLPEMDKLRILVTGGSGFVGSNLVDRFIFLLIVALVVSQMH